jgi:hypothetical protein
VPVNSKVRRARTVEWMQNTVFRRAQRVIVNNEAFAAALRETRLSLPVSMVPNAVDTELLPARHGDRFTGCSIAHVGTLYAGRSLTSVLDAMSALITARPDAASQFRLRLAGHMEQRHREQFNNDLAQHGIGDMVTLEGVLSRPAALDLLMRSHIALVLAQDQRFCVPAKLYEALGLGVPALVITEKGSASAREAARVGATAVDPADTKDLTRIFSDALDGHTPPAIHSANMISYEKSAAEMDRLFRTEL